MDVEFTKEFWTKVQSEFIKDTNNCLFCIGSLTFADRWLFSEKKTPIINLAKEFITAKEKKSVSNTAYLFFNPHWDFDNHREIRLEFLNWVIEYLEN